MGIQVAIGVEQLDGGGQIVIHQLTKVVNDLRMVLGALQDVANHFLDLVNLGGDLLALDSLVAQAYLGDIRLPASKQGCSILAHRGIGGALRRNGVC